MRDLITSAVAIAAVLGCGAGDRRRCVDGDGDGTGPGCPQPDCNDALASVHEEPDCAELCVDHPQASGCPCDDEPATSCYEGPAGTEDVGLCHAGIAGCVGGAWGPCEGQLGPAAETCDGLDNDCDAEVDEGVRGECGGCGPCLSACFGPEDGCEALASASTIGLVEAPEMWLALGARTAARSVLWIPSTARATVLRVDPLGRRIEAAFRTGPNHELDPDGGAQDWPTYSTVDRAGNLLISNEAIGGLRGDHLGSVTKIAADPTACVDRNGNGRIDTSAGWDDVLPFDDHETWADECILWHTVVQQFQDSAIPRGIVLTDERGGWVAVHGEAKIKQFDPETGELTWIEIDTEPSFPMALAVDHQQRVWLAGSGVPPVYGWFDPRDPVATFETFPSPIWAEEILVDENDHPWMSGGMSDAQTCEDAYRWDREAGEWEAAGLGGGATCVGNIASDGLGSIWAATWGTAEGVWRIENDADFGHELVATPGVAGFSIAVDAEGHPWALPGAWTEIPPGVLGSEIDPVAGGAELVVADCGGAPCLDDQRSRGDVTGVRNWTALGVGRWSTVIEGCPGAPDPPSWHDVAIDGDLPEGSSIEVAARVGPRRAVLPAVDWTVLGTIRDGAGSVEIGPAVSPAADARVLEIRLVVQAAASAATPPVLRGVQVRWGCPMGPVE